MSRIPTPALVTATGATAEVYAQIKKAVGKVPNTFATIGALGPAALKAILQADGVLAASTFSKQDQETVKLIVSGLAGCDYCVAAHSLLGKWAGLNPEVLEQIRAGKPTGDAKRDALVRFVRDSGADQRHDHRRAVRGHQGRRLRRRAAGGHQPGNRPDRLHQRLQSHQRHRARLSSGRTSGRQAGRRLSKGAEQWTRSSRP